MSDKRPIHVIPFSHLDLFWGGTREECLSRGGRIIHTALNLLEKYPEYRFMIESFNFIETYLDCHPEELNRIKMMIRSGRLEVIPMRAIIYSHLPSGETTIRNLIYGREYCRNVLETDPTIMSMSDIPGVTPQLPQIARLAGMTEIVLSRGFREHTDHVMWSAMDGTSIPSYCPMHYADLALALSHEKFDRMLASEKDFEKYAGAVDYPQIINWGMDLYVLNEKILQNILRWNNEGHRKLNLSTFREFFDACKKQDIPYKNFKGEIPSTWPHIESSWPDLWPLDISAENNMFNAEYFGAINLLAGHRNDYPHHDMRRAWLQLLDSMDHNQNGIGGPVSDKDKLNLKLSAGLTAGFCAQRYAWRIAAQATAPHSRAHPIVIFNPLSWARSGVVSARNACYGTTYATSVDQDTTSHEYYKKNKPPHFRLLDETGREIPFKIDQHLMMLTDTLEISFFADHIPAFGCKVYYLEVAEPQKFPSPFVITRDRDEDLKNSNRYLGCDVVENRFYRVEISRLTGELSIYDKINDRKIVDRACIVGLEERRGEYIFNMDFSGRIMPTIIDDIEIVEDHAVYCRIVIHGSVYHQKFTQTITISADEPVIDIENQINWREERYVRIEQSFPFASEEKADIRYGVPFGMVKYPETIYQQDGVIQNSPPHDPTKQIRIVRDWVDASDSKGGMTIAGDHRMWTFDGNTMRNCMVRGIGWTSGGILIRNDDTQKGVVRPPAGNYIFRYRITTHTAHQAPAYRVGYELNRPVYPVAVANASNADHPGLALPELPDTSDSTIVIPNIKLSENGHGIILRCFEAEGRSSSIHLPVVVGKTWYETDLMEEKIHKLNGEPLLFRAFEIKTLLLQ